MQKHEINLADQHRRIGVWRQNVENFLNSPRMADIPCEHQEAMFDELDALDHLERALTRRMELLGLPV